MPWPRDRIRHLGGKMLDTRTRLQAAMPAERRASSNDVSFSRCFPTPFVKNISLGTNPITSRSLVGTVSIESIPDGAGLSMDGTVHGKHAPQDCQPRLASTCARLHGSKPREP